MFYVGDVQGGQCDLLLDLCHLLLSIGDPLTVRLQCVKIQCSHREA